MAEQAAEHPDLKPESSSGAESPTTAKELDFEDEAPTASEPQPTKKVSFQEDGHTAGSAGALPAKPPRPMSSQAQAESTLMEAFPSVDAKVVKAVLVASGGKIEPAFNALLSMSDPDFVEEQHEAPPPQPPRRAAAQQMEAQRQLEQDERYARQLAAHYEERDHAHVGYRSRGEEEPPLPPRRAQTGLKPNEMYDDKEHSFFDDDLPVIKENMRQGFLQTQKTVNKWLTDFKKKLDGDEVDNNDDFVHHQRPGQSSSSQGFQRQDFGPSQSAQLYGIRKSGEVRRSGDHNRYDADPRVLGDDFAQLELRDDDVGSPQLPRGGSRPLANPDLFKPTPVAPSGPVDEVDALYRAPDNRAPSHGHGKAGTKWQPLTSVAPNAESDDHDPFSLGDSDEEEAKRTDVKAEDTVRLKQAAVEKDKANGPGGAKLEAAETSGTIDKEAADLLKKS